MEYLRTVLKKGAKSSMIESIVIAILGIILVCKPEGTLKVVTYILGAIFIIMGIYKIINYFAKSGKNDFYNFDLIYGLTSIVIGIVAMAYMDIIGSIFRIIIGVWIIYTSFVRINTSLQIKRIGNNVWDLGINFGNNYVYMWFIYGYKFRNYNSFNRNYYDNLCNN